jgi:hypothetical protein
MIRTDLDFRKMLNSSVFRAARILQWGRLAMSKWRWNGWRDLGWWKGHWPGCQVCPSFAV